MGEINICLINVISNCIHRTFVFLWKMQRDKKKKKKTWFGKWLTGLMQLSFFILNCICPGNNSVAFPHHLYYDRDLSLMHPLSTSLLHREYKYPAILLLGIFPLWDDYILPCTSSTECTTYPPNPPTPHTPTAPPCPPMAFHHNVVNIRCIMIIACPKWTAITMCPFECLWNYLHLFKQE